MLENDDSDMAVFLEKQVILFLQHFQQASFSLEIRVPINSTV